MANMASACAFVVSNESSFNPVRSWSTKTAATTCIIVSVAVVSICVMAVCGVFIVREYSLSASYKKTKCWVSNITFPEIRSCTYCTQKHKTVSTCSPSKFPCVRIRVAYEMDGGIREGLLHSDSIEAAGLFSQCSHHVCVGDFATNEAAIHQYVEKYKNLMSSHIEHNMRYPNNNKPVKTHGDKHGTKLEEIINKYLNFPELTTTSVLLSSLDEDGEDSEEESEKKNENHLDKNTNRNKNKDEKENNDQVKTEMLSKKTLPDMNSTILTFQTIHPAIMERMKEIIENKTYARSSDRSSFTCFYNQERPFDVIEHKTYTKWDAIHSMLWPAVVIAVCCFLFLYIETQRRQLTCCGRKPLEYVARKKKHHHRHHHHHHQYHRASDAEEVAMESVNKGLEPRHDNDVHKNIHDFDEDSNNGSHNNPTSTTNLCLNNNNNNEDENKDGNCEENNNISGDCNSNNNQNNNLNNNNNNNHHINNHNNKADNNI